VKQEYQECRGIRILAMLLAAIGLGGTVAQSTAAKLKEFGIRLVLGASERSLITSGSGAH